VDRNIIVSDLVVQFISVSALNSADLRFYQVICGGFSTKFCWSAVFRQTAIKA